VHNNLLTKGVILSDQEKLESKRLRMPSESAAIAIALVTNWAYSRVTNAGFLPSRRNNVQRIRFEKYVGDSHSSGCKDIVELRRDSHRQALSFCAIRAILPKTNPASLSEAGDYLTARMHFLQQRQRTTNTKTILYDSWISPVNPQLDVPEIDFDELEASQSEEQLDHVVLGDPVDVLSEAASARIMFIISSIVDIAANRVSTGQQHTAIPA